MPSTRLLLALLAPATSGEIRSGEFINELEQCIRNHARRLAQTFPQWGDKCGPVTAKVDFQAALYEETLTPILEKHGYTGALWFVPRGLSPRPSLICRHTGLDSRTDSGAPCIRLAWYPSSTRRRCAALWTPNRRATASFARSPPRLSRLCATACT
jgi:hypothetical protein